jgi:hypothetical protein
VGIYCHDLHKDYGKSCEAVNDLVAEKINEHSILLSWSEPESGLPVVEYRVYRNAECRKQNAECRKAEEQKSRMEEFELVGITTNTTFLDENLQVGEYEYYVVAFYEMDCVSDSSNHVRVEVDLGVKELKELEGVRVYPNPAFTTVTIVAENFKKVEIYNAFGQLLQVAATKVVDVSSFHSGVYFLKVYTEKGMVVKKVVKQ